MTMTLREEALKLHLDNNGKIAVSCKVPIANRHDLALAYTPGVAEPCKDIKEDKGLSFEYTCRGNMVAIIIKYYILISPISIFVNTYAYISSLSTIF